MIDKILVVHFKYCSNGNSVINHLSSESSTTRILDLLCKSSFLQTEEHFPEMNTIYLIVLKTPDGLIRKGKICLYFPSPFVYISLVLTFLHRRNDSAVFSLERALTYPIYLHTCTRKVGAFFSVVISSLVALAFPPFHTTINCDNLSMIFNIFFFHHFNYFEVSTNFLDLINNFKNKVHYIMKII